MIKKKRKDEITKTAQEVYNKTAESFEGPIPKIIPNDIYNNLEFFGFKNKEEADTFVRAFNKHGNK